MFTALFLLNFKNSQKRWNLHCPNWCFHRVGTSKVCTAWLKQTCAASHKIKTLTWLVFLVICGPGIPLGFLKKSNLWFLLISGPGCSGPVCPPVNRAASHHFFYCFSIDQSNLMMSLVRRWFVFIEILFFLSSLSVLSDPSFAALLFWR